MEELKRANAAATHELDEMRREVRQGAASWFEGHGRVLQQGGGSL